MTDDQDTVTYQFEVDAETWQDWKRTVPRDKSLRERIVELLEADTNGLVGERAESGREPVESRPPETRDRSGADQPAAAESDESDSTTADADLAAVVDEVAAGWDDRPERLNARKAAARAVLEYTREHGTVSKKAAKEEVFPEHPVEDQNARTWYRKNARPVLNEAAEYDQSARAYRLTEEYRE